MYVYNWYKIFLLLEKAIFAEFSLTLGLFFYTIQYAIFQNYLQQELKNKRLPL